ncbi:MAG: hypothetical protein NT040_06855 [Bacteroidetes bacterium]|nr:hypothetical protein [Bacteroidota bacterium]
MIETKLARVISYLFHPLMMPCYVLVLLLNLNSFLALPLPFSYNMALFAVVFLTTVLFPLFLTWMLYRLGIIASVFMTTKEERTYPILAISVFYYLTYFLLRGIHISAIFSYYMLGATLLAIISLILNFSRKISLHMIGIGSLTGLFLGLSLNFGIDLQTEIFSGILLAGIIGFARLKTNSHQPAEIYSGFAMGVIVMTVLLTLL